MFLHLRKEERRQVLQKHIHEVYSSRHRSLSSLAIKPEQAFRSIISDAVFTEANKVFDAFVKDLRYTGKIAGVVHKKAVSKDQIERRFKSVELGPADSQNPAQLQRTAWLYLTLFIGRRGTEKPWNALPKNNAIRFRVF